MASVSTTIQNSQTLFSELASCQGKEVQEQTMAVNTVLVNVNALHHHWGIGWKDSGADKCCLWPCLICREALRGEERGGGEEKRHETRIKTERHLEEAGEVSITE